MNYDVIIVGAGPGGIFSAYELTRLRPELKVAVFEAGHPLKNRKCPIDGVKVKSCIACKSCSIMSGFGGAGAFSDGKYNITNDFGGTLYEYLGKAKALELMRYVDQINMAYGGEGTKLYSTAGTRFKKLCIQNKLNLLDAIDEQNSSGKLNLIIQLPYVIKTEARRQQAELRRQDIENQLASSKYGVAYTDGTEHVVQLNRPVENNLMSQIEYLTSMLYSQLGLTQGILDGSADDKTMQNYLTRIVEPILSAIVDEIKRKFLTKTARSQKQSILFFRDPFKLVPVDKIAEMTDKFTRNEVMTSNEIRQKIGMKPSSDPKADELRNSNLSAPAESTPASTPKEDNNQNGEET